MNDNTYKYIEIKECFIPIYKNLKLIEKSSTYEYSYISPGIDGIHDISIYKKKLNSYNKILNMAKKIKDLDLIAVHKKNDFTIITMQFRNNPVDKKLYFLLGTYSIILMKEQDETEINYLLDYCKQSKKKENFILSFPSQSPAIK